MGINCCKRKSDHQCSKLDIWLDDNIIDLIFSERDRSEGKDLRPRYPDDRYGFHTFCGNGDLDVVKSIVETYNLDINRCDTQGRTPLYVAAINGRIDVVRCLVSAGADLNHGSNYEQSPLHAAALCNKPEICKFLVSAGANVNILDCVRATPLFWAVHKGCREAVSALVESGAEVNVTNSKQRIPFHAATMRDDVRTMHLLFTNGADPETKGPHDYTPLHLAAEHGCYAAAHFLIVGICVSLDKVNGSKQTAFHCAMTGRHRYILDLLVMAGYDAQREGCIYDRPPHWLLGVDEDQKLTQRYAQIARNPRGLQDLCIFRIRHLLGRHLPSVVNKLPAPPKVTRLLKLTHIPQF